MIIQKAHPTSYILHALVTASFLAMLPAQATAQQTLLFLSNTDLEKLDPVTVKNTVLDPLGLPVTTGMDFWGGKLYVLPEGSSNLFEIDPATGATLSGPIVIAGPAPGIEGDLAFRSDGVGFVSALSGGLWRFDLSKPAPTFTLLTAGPPGFDGLAFDAAGVLWGVEEGGKQIYTIDQVTGVATKVGAPTGFDSGVISCGGVAIDNTGKFYASFGTNFFTIDPVTGLGTLIGTYPGTRGLRFIPSAAVLPVPPVGGAPSGNEGNYVGCNGSSGNTTGEGEFGFGARKTNRAELKRAALSGPFRGGKLSLPAGNAAGGDLRVQNISGLGIVTAPNGNIDSYSDWLPAVTAFGSLLILAYFIGRHLRV